MTTGGLHIDVMPETATWAAALPDAETVARHATLTAWQKAGDTNRNAEVSIVFGDDDMVQRLNGTYRDQDKPTNVLSFPADGDEAPAGAPCLLGDIVLAYETIAREAQEQDKTLSDHLSHLCVHGMLHLLGYDHQTDDEAEDMEALEVAILAGIGIADPFVTALQEV